MLKNPNQFINALKLKCPRCKTGDLFIDKNPYHLKTLADMPKFCTVCKQTFNPEVGFYYGAMWVSYLVSILLSVIIILIALYLFRLELKWAFIVFIVFQLLISPYLFRFSRALWLSFYVKQHKDI